MTRLISLGAGTQSSAMLLMAIEGLFGDMPDGAIFADTQGEPQHVYEWLDRLEKHVAPFPIHRVSKGCLGEDYIAGIRRAAIPCFSTNLEGKTIMMNRFCSKTYKVEEIMRAARRIVGPKGQCEIWIGISTDEAHRGFKNSGVKWAQNRYPLLEYGISREMCSDFVLSRLGVRPPKSACLFCPFHADSQWLWMREYSPFDFLNAVRYDYSIRNISYDKWDRPRFLHRSLKPLDKVIFKHEGQLRLLDQFGNECEGVCGV